MSPITDKAQIDALTGVQHHFCGGVYAKQIRLQRGMVVEQHAHTFDHLSVLASGRVQLVVDDAPSIHVAPAALSIAAGKRHRIEALEDSTWFCIHATDITDPERVDAALVAQEG